jgi:hypothetical protein
MPVAGSNARYVPTVTDTVYGIDLTSGRKEWTARLAVEDPSVSVVDDTVAVAGGRYVSLELGQDRALVARSFDDGVDTRWTASIDGEATTSPVVAGDTGYAGGEGT